MHASAYLLVPVECKRDTIHLPDEYLFVENFAFTFLAFATLSTEMSMPYTCASLLRFSNRFRVAPPPCYICFVKIIKLGNI